MVFSHVLSSPPTILQAGISTHGPAKKESFYVHTLWSLNLFDYEAVVRYGNLKFSAAPGIGAIIPPATQRTFTGTGLRYHRYIHFQLPVESHPKPIFVQTGSEYRFFTDAHDTIIREYKTKPDRCRALLWEVLWRLSDKHQSDYKNDSSMERILGWIESNLQRNIRINEAAKEAGYSHNHFIRLFTQKTGTTPAKYIKMRKIQKAAHLLTHTDLPVKAIALETGNPNLQQFNKFFRSETGDSPRNFRSKNRS